ncbi:MAG: hypothetical protein LBO09_06750 [Candidatus Peribacteria bacterium]|jgi:hypothetical protein|nr:hypothetical protein [Candidatus Peribacteria bacterium]
MGLNRRGRTALHLGNTPTSLPKPIIKTTVNTSKMLVDVLGTTANKGVDALFNWGKLFSKTHRSQAKTDYKKIFGDWKTDVKKDNADYIAPLDGEYQKANTPSKLVAGGVHGLTGFVGNTRDTVAGAVWRTFTSPSALFSGKFKSNRKNYGTDIKK